jgi:hypothetical protein
MGRLALLKGLIFSIFCLLSIFIVVYIVPNIKPSFLSNIIYAQHIPGEGEGTPQNGSQYSDQLDPNAKNVTDLPEGTQPYNEKVYENGVLVDNINHLPGEPGVPPPGEGEGRGEGEGEGDCFTSWELVGNYSNIGCNMTLPVNFQTIKVKMTMTGGGGGDQSISFYCCGSGGANWRSSDNNTYAVTDQSGTLAVNQVRTTGYFGPKTITSQYFSVGCNDGETMSVRVERCVPPATPTPTPTPTLTPPSPPIVVVNTPKGCVDGPYSGNEVTISWTNPGVPVSWVDITNDAGGWWNKNVAGLSSTTAPNGFKDGPTQTQDFIGQPNTTYYVGLWNGTHSPVSSFSIPLCRYTIQGNVFVDLDKDGVKDPNENNYSSPITITSSDGSVTYPSTGSYLVGNLTSGSKTVIFTLPTGYKATYPTGTPISWTVTVGPACSVGGAGSHGASCDASGNIQNLNFGISNSYPWFVCVGADCRIDPGVIDPIPFGPPPTTADCSGTAMQSYASVNGGLSNSPGIVFSGDSTPDFGLGRASSQGWLVGGIFSPAKTNIIRTAYDYMMTSIKQKGVTPIQIKNTGECGGAANCVECNPDNCDPGNFTASGVYTSAQSLVLKNQAFTFPGAKSYVFLINGDLTIQNNLIVPIGSTVTFSVSRDILVDKNLGESNPGRVCDPLTHQYCNLEGYFSADRNFVIQANSTDCPARNDKKLNIAGSIVVNAALGGGAFVNQRDLCGDNLNCPTFTITERPDFILTAPDFIKYPNYIWREVAP